MFAEEASHDREAERSEGGHSSPAYPHGCSSWAKRSLGYSASFDIQPSYLLCSSPGKAVSSGQIPTSLPEVIEVPRTPDGEKGCESCLAISATRWYQWGPAHEHCRLCNFCYTYWRKYGGLKLPTRWGRHACWCLLYLSHLVYASSQRPVIRRLEL